MTFDLLTASVLNFRPNLLTLTFRVGRGFAGACTVGGADRFYAGVEQGGVEVR